MRRLLLFALPASLLLLQIVTGQIADPDLWGRLSVGAVLFQSGHLPRIDDFSWTAAGAPWVDHEWLAGVVFYALLSVAGEPGLVLFKYALTLLALWLVFVLHASVHRVRLEYAAYALAVLSPVVRLGFGSSVRAQVFSIVAFVGFLVVLERVRAGRAPLRALCWLLPAGVLWGNLHGGFVMGVLGVACYAASEAFLGRAKRAGIHLIVGAGLLASVAISNPYGPRYLEFLIHAWTLDRSGITEWRPLLHGFPALAPELAIAALAALAAGSLALRGAVRALRERGAARGSQPPGATGNGARPDLAPSLVLGLVVSMTLLSARIAPFLALALAAYLPLFVVRPAGPSEPPTRAWIGRLAGWWIPAAVSVAALLGLALQERPLLRTIVPQPGTPGTSLPWQYPLGAAEFLRGSAYSGRLLNPFNKGQFLYWTLYPRFRVAIDGRYEEVYTRQQFRDAYRFYRRSEGERPEAVVEDAERSGADFILCPSRWRAKDVLDRSESFELIYDDGTFALLARGDGSHARAPVERGPGTRQPATIATVFEAGGRERFAGYPRPEAGRLPKRSQ